MASSDSATRPAAPPLSPSRAHLRAPPAAPREAALCAGPPRQVVAKQQDKFKALAASQSPKAGRRAAPRPPHTSRGPVREVRFPARAGHDHRVLRLAGGSGGAVRSGAGRDLPGEGMRSPHPAARRRRPAATRLLAGAVGCESGAALRARGQLPRHLRGAGVRGQQPGGKGPCRGPPRAPEQAREARDG